MKLIYVFLFIFVINNSIYSQVGINNTNPNAILDITSSNQASPANNDGLLIPRIDTFPLINPTIDQQSMLVYLTNDIIGFPRGFYYWENSLQSWVSLSGLTNDNNWNLQGNDNINEDLNFIGTLNNQNIVFKRNNVFSGEIGVFNTSFGVQSGSSPLNNGAYNSSYGTFSFQTNITGSDNCSFGTRSLRYNLSGIRNVAIGVAALEDNTSGSDNISIGAYALDLSANNDNNIAIGAFSLTSFLNGSNNVSIGRTSMFQLNSGNNNTALGNRSMVNSPSGSNNVSVGYYSLANTDGDSNTAVGAYSSYFNGSGINNTSLGYRSLYRNSYDNNTAVGYNSLYYNELGSNNTSLGANSGSNTTNQSYSNSTALGANTSITASNQIRLGDVNVTSIGGFNNWTNISDKRFKINIKENVPGLNFINRLRPVSYNLDKESLKNFISDRFFNIKLNPDNTVYSGFIAQEVEASAKEIGYVFSGIDYPKNDKDLYGLRYSEFVVPLVKAVQEQQILIKNQANTINDLLKRIQDLENLVYDNNQK